MQDLTPDDVALDGTWDFFPHDADLADLASLEPTPISIPALWEAQGHPDLDGAAWYRRRFGLDDTAGRWSLRFGAVMDLADVYLNGEHLGSHDGGFTPFELDATRSLVRGENVLAVRVEDPPLGHPEHARMPHGKQGWNNGAFPSRPSLYMTYGGIWQPVVLHRHGPVIARDVFVDGRPEDLTATLDVCNCSTSTRAATVTVATLGQESAARVELGPGQRSTLTFRFGGVAAERWSPERPVLHEAVVGIRVAGEPAERQTVRYGLRTVRIDGSRIRINDEPYRMRSVLVQGFRAEELYAEGDRAAIVEEVAAAKRMGFNTVRLHIKAFDPAYLDVCDELGMLVHCDLPVAEPVDYDEFGADTVLARRCIATAREQVRRDRNHPSVILWSAMNEVGERRPELRSGPAYAAFVDALVDAIEENDGTRPVIENDWIEFSGATVRRSRILTAHWYGRLHRDYFDKVSRKLGRWRDDGRVLLVTEYGDWGLPELPALPAPPFWDPQALYAEALPRAHWPHSLDRFVEETQRYQGVSNRLQTEVFRRHDHLSGYCLTELTDVPHELNGLLDLHRRAKEPAVAEMTRANQRVLPMLDLRSFVVAAGEEVAAALHVANDGPPLRDVVVEVDGSAVSTGDLAGDRATRLGDVTVRAAAQPGCQHVELRLTTRGETLTENRYPLRVIDAPNVDADVRVVGEGPTAAALRGLGASVGRRGTTIVAESALTREVGAALARELADGASVVVLAQSWETSRAYPLPVRIQLLDTRWGSSAFTFTTGRAPLSPFPDAAVLVGEDATLHARGLVVDVGGRPYPDEPLVVRYNPVGSAGTLVGVHGVGRGRLVFCQLRVAGEALAGDLAARALLADLVRLAQPS